MIDASRNLLACPHCKRQFDVGALAYGECIRCLCGETLRWSERPAHSPARRRCPHCGAALAAEARACSYCSAEIQLSDRGLSEVCPACYARLLHGAHYCMECGIAIEPQALFALPVDLACPRCHAALRRRTLGPADVIECGACGGLWLTPDVVKRLVEHAETEDLSVLGLPEPAAQAESRAAVPGYIPCVTCGELMQRRNFGGASGVVVDACGKHGVWFDPEELERVLAFVRKGGLRRAREREVARQEARLLRARGEAGADGVPGSLLPEPREHARGDFLDALAGCGRLLADLLRS